MGIRSFLRALRIAFRLLSAYIDVSIRRARFYLLFLTAKRRLDDVEKLTLCVGFAFKDASPSFSSVRFGLTHGPGYATFTSGERLPICSEAPITIYVYLERTLACAMSVELRGDTLSIRQLQGVHGVRPPSELALWPRLFVEACQHYARAYGVVRRVRIYRADQSLFFRFPERPAMEEEEDRKWLEAHQQRMRRRYDGTARQLGFAMKRTYGEWENPNYARL